MKSSPTDVWYIYTLDVNPIPHVNGHGEALEHVRRMKNTEIWKIHLELK